MFYHMVKAPFTFLNLEDERGVKLLYHNLIITALLAILLSLPFIVLDSTNYFHKDGFVDKVSSFSSVLTGFYVAGLVAVAAFSPALGDIDAKIEQGRVILRSHDDDISDHDLSRREYTSYLFGYLAFISLCVTLIGILIVIVAGSITFTAVNIDIGRYALDFPVKSLRVVSLILVNVVLSHMFIITVQGIYYLTDRVYTRNPQTLPDRTEHNHLE